MFENPNAGYDARVAQGVALLSSQNPQWFHGIDIATLDVRNGRACILAQLADGSWTHGVRTYHVRDASLQFNCGFYESPDIPDSLERYGRLTAAWRRAIIALCAGTYVGVFDRKVALAV